MAPLTHNAQASSDLPSRGRVIRAGQAALIHSLLGIAALTDGDIILAVVLICIHHANTEMLRRMDSSPHAFARQDGPAPDELRQPVSVYAIAKSLGMPYETVRRHVAKLISMGMCKKVGDKGGVIVPQSVISSTAFASLLDRHYEELLHLNSLIGALPDA